MGVRRRPRAPAALHGRHDALGGRGRAGHRDGRALPHAHARRLGRGRRPGRDRRVGGGLRSRLVVGHRHRPARALAAARPARRVTPTSSCGWPTASRAPASWAGSPSRSRRRPCAGTCAARCSSSSARSSTSACAGRPRSGARPAASLVVPAPARAEADRQARDAAVAQAQHEGAARSRPRLPGLPHEDVVAGPGVEDQAAVRTGSRPGRRRSACRGRRSRSGRWRASRRPGRRVRGRRRARRRSGSRHRRGPRCRRGWVRGSPGSRGPDQPAAAGAAARSPCSCASRSSRCPPRRGPPP